MATINVDFTATVDAWARESQDRLERIFKQSSQQLGSVANNGVPVDTGFARASFRASNEAMPLIDPGATNKSHGAVAQDFGQITATIASARLGQTLYMGWTAAYILPLEYGHSKQAPQGFARLAAMQWPSIVSSVVGEAKVRAAA